MPFFPVRNGKIYADGVGADPSVALTGQVSANFRSVGIRESLCDPAFNRIASLQKVWKLSYNATVGAYMVNGTQPVCSLYIPLWAIPIEIRQADQIPVALVDPANTAEYQIVRFDFRVYTGNKSLSGAIGSATAGGMVYLYVAGDLTCPDDLTVNATKQGFVVACDGTITMTSGKKIHMNDKSYSAHTTAPTKGIMVAGLSIPELTAAKTIPADGTGFYGTSYAGAAGPGGGGAGGAVGAAAWWRSSLAGSGGGCVTGVTRTVYEYYNGYYRTNSYSNAVAGAAGGVDITSSGGLLIIFCYNMSLPNVSSCSVKVNSSTGTTGGGSTGGTATYVDTRSYSYGDSYSGGSSSASVTYGSGGGAGGRGGGCVMIFGRSDLPTITSTVSGSAAATPGGTAGTVGTVYILKNCSCF